MPAGVPVATVTLNGAKNAGILAAEIISTFDNATAEKLEKYKSDLKIKVQDMQV
jgi:5-(carboxyamino)imidazole ribonucleotide mutase